MAAESESTSTPPPQRSVVTFGVFDGVHRGHQALLGEVVAQARERGDRAIVLTFDPQPAVLHRPDKAPPLICSVVDRVELLRAQGLDDVIVVPYTERFAAQGPEAFVRHYLQEQFGVEAIVLGADARFGRGNEGDLAMLQKLGAAFSFDVISLGGVGDKNAAQRWSSSKVRAALASGDVAEAARLLGRNHFLRGVVVRGDARGRTLGFPTANLGSASGLIPADGVYAGYLSWHQMASGDATAGCGAKEHATAGGGAKEHSDRVFSGVPGESRSDWLGWNHPMRLPAAISIGTNPTFDGQERRVEAYVLDRTDLELYDREVTIEFVARIRGTEKFDSVDELVIAMRRDVDSIRRIIAEEHRAGGD